MINTSLSNDFGIGCDVLGNAINSFESLYKPTVVINVLGSVSNVDSENVPSVPVVYVGLLEKLNSLFVMYYEVMRSRNIFCSSWFEVRTTIN